MGISIILLRNIKWRFHNAFTIVITILQPALWLLLYSAVAGNTMKGTGIENYTAFVFPGLIVLVSFSACSSGGIMNYMMKSDGSFFRILIAPIRRSSIVLGHLLEAVLCTFLEVSIMALISFFFSVRVAAGWGGVCLASLFVFLTAFFISGLTYGISLILPNEVIYETVMNAIVLPVFFLSSALFPTDEVGGFLGLMIRANPFTYIIDILRSIIVSGNVKRSQVLFALFLFIAMGVIGFRWALSRLNKETAL